ncbi:hypothetical protein C0991_011360 [Blastosporella zonata]|nr:hypothetical protein C0991_011360 [Blastosporella zonata]
MSFLPTELWQHMFLLCPTNNDYPSTSSAPLLLCHVCSAWRALAISTPLLWRSITVAISLGPTVRPNLNLVSLWLDRSQKLPVSLALSQSTNSDASRDIAEEALRIFATHGSRWQRLDLDLPGMQYPWIGQVLNIHAPVLEEFHVRAYHQPVDDLFKTFWYSTPRLSSITVSSLPIELMMDPEIQIPWSRLLDVSVQSVPSVHTALAILSECHCLQVCEFRIESHVSDEVVHFVTVCSNALRELRLHIQCVDFGVFLEFTVFPALEFLAVYGVCPDLSYWPHDQFVDHIHRSNTHLKTLKLHTAWLWSPQFSTIFNQPALQSLTKLIIDDDLDWDLMPCFLPVVIPLIRDIGTNSLLPRLEVLEIAGYLSGINASAVLDMAEARWTGDIAKLKILRLHCCSKFELTANHRLRMENLKKEGLKLSIS